MAVAIALVTFAAFVEVVQLFVPGRHARLSDFAIDALAAIIGLIVARLLGLIRAPS
jgi:VanZ family protein